MGWWVVPAALSVFGGIAQYRSAKQMDALAAQQALMVERNAALQEQELQESIKRQQRQNMLTLGRAQAAAAGAGVEMEGSPAAYIAFIENEQRTQLEWDEMAGRSQIDLQRETGMLNVQTTRLQARQQRIGAFTSLVNAAGFMGKSGLFSNPTGAA